MTTLEILKAGRTLLTPPGTWIQGLAAQDREGFGILPEDADAICWCSLGALRRVRQGATVSYAQALLQLVNGMPCQPEGDFCLAELVFRWNDQPGRTQDEVLALFDKAIAAEESQQ